MIAEKPGCKLEFHKKGDSMKKAVSMILLCLFVLAVCVGCGNKTAEKKQTTAIANPWSDWDSIGQAESIVGFSFGLPEGIAGSYNAVNIRTMNKELIEVVYLYEDFEVCVRKQEGEGQDISGDYNDYDAFTETSQNGGTITTYHNANNNAVKQIVSYKGYSWSLVAPNGYWGDSNADFLRKIWEQ